MITEERIQKLPGWIRRVIIFLKKMRVPVKIVYITISILATIWFLIRVIPKPSRPGSIFASQDGVAIDAVAVDFAIAEWPDAPDMMYSDYSVNECALAYNPPSGTVYDPERDGTRLISLGTSEHWSNATDKKYSRNLKTGKGIELVCSGETDCRQEGEAANP